MASRLNIAVHDRTIKHLRLPGGEISFVPGFLGPLRARTLAASLLAEGALAWRDDRIVMFGRRVAQPRRTLWMADAGVGYTYSGLTLAPEPWIGPIAQLRDDLQALLGVPLNSVLANLYRDGRDHMGWHRDNEAELGPEPLIASISLGAARDFDLRHREFRDNGVPVQRFGLRSGDLIVMRGATQANWHHRVPRRLTAGGARINLSFRHTRSGS